MACDNDENNSSSDDEIIQAYLLENELTDSTSRDDSGIYYQVLVENISGERATTGDVLGIYYSANALNEQDFDAHTNNGTNLPMKLQYNTKSIFPIGLEDCLGLMKTGEKAIFYIPSVLAFGDLKDVSSIIPDGSVIRMTIELDTIQTEADILVEETELIENFIVDNRLNDLVNVPLDSVQLLPSGVYYKSTVAGNNNDSLLVGELVDIRYLLYYLEGYPGTAIDGTGNSGGFLFPFQQDVVVRGLDAGLDVMKINEQALLMIPSHLGYGASAFVIPQYRKDYFVENEVIPEYTSVVAPYKILVFNVHLLNTPIVN